MTAPQFADISVFQPADIDWQAYRTWSARGDGIARVSIRSSYGTGYTDKHFGTYRAAALTTNIETIVYYHYAYPQYNKPEDEADWQHQVVGVIRPTDVIMLDFEENVSAATAAWAYAWLARQEQNYGGALPTIYASDAYIKQRLQDSRLKKYPLTLAFWSYSTDTRPPCPLPWSQYTYLQYSDHETVPGISTPVDANLYLGGTPTSTTTFELANFPMVSQRDGDPNQDYDCVPASIAAGMEWLTGQTFTAREIKDSVYGISYTGGTAATAYVDYCATNGVSLFPVNGDGSTLVTTLHTEIARQHPVLITEPDPYAAGWTHVCVAYKSVGGTVTVMDPWIDAPVTKSDATWAATLVANQVWVMEKAMLDISAVSHYFTATSADVWKASNGNVVGHGMLGFIRRTGSAPLYGFTLYGLPLTNELPVTTHPGVVLQVFERGVLCYDPKHVLDSPPGGGDVYPMHIDSGEGLKALLSLLKIDTTPTPTLNVADAVATLQTLATDVPAKVAQILKDLGA